MEHPPNSFMNQRQPILMTSRDTCCPQDAILEAKWEKELERERASFLGMEEVKQKCKILDALGQQIRLKLAYYLLEKDRLRLGEVEFLRQPTKI